MRYEIFNPINGVPLYTVRYLWTAKLICKLSRTFLDYAPVGQGWTL